MLVPPLARRQSALAGGILLNCKPQGLSQRCQLTDLHRRRLLHCTITQHTTTHHCTPPHITQHTTTHHCTLPHITAHYHTSHSTLPHITAHHLPPQGPLLHALSLAFSCTMDTKGRTKSTSFLLSNTCWRMSISATSVFPPLVGRE